MIPVAWAGVRGWLYPPQSRNLCREPLLFLSAVGTEDLCARHSMGLLARDLAARGHAVLRMDLPGTGDSLGTLLEDDRWESWLEATLEGLTNLRRWTGHSSVGIVALRLGALVGLAATCHGQAGDLGSLVLLAPVLQGRQYLRELRTLATPGERLAVDGIEWGDKLQSAIRQVDAASFGPPPVQRVLLAANQAGKGQEAWIGRCDSAGLPVSCVPYGDLAAHIGDTIAGHAPKALWDLIPTWLAEDTSTCIETIVAPTTEPTLVGKGYTETGVLLPWHKPLAAVISLPSEGLSASTPIVLLANTGRNPHTGWARSWVKLARDLAQIGIAAVRFDIAGTGDSPAAEIEGELLYNDASLPQMAAVIDWIDMQLGGGRPIVSVGLCTGGYLAFHSATQDKRVTHLLLLNVQKYIWVPGTSLQIVLRNSAKSAQAYRKLLFQPKTWKRLFSGDIDLRTVATRLSQLGGQAVARLLPMGRVVMPSASASGESVSAQRTPHAIREAFKALSARGTPITVLYSEDDGGRDEFARYFGHSGKAFTRLARTRLAVLAGADHMLTRESDLQAVLYEIELLLKHH